jgi:hypothetical protein
MDEYYAELGREKTEKELQHNKQLKAEIKSYCQSWIETWQRDRSAYNDGAKKVAEKVLMMLE